MLYNYENKPKAVTGILMATSKYKHINIFRLMALDCKYLKTIIMIIYPQPNNRYFS